MALGLEVELFCRQPHSLERLTQHIPHHTAHLAKRPVEDKPTSFNCGNHKPPVPRWFPVLNNPNALFSSHPRLLRRLMKRCWRPWTPRTVIPHWKRYGLAGSARTAPTNAD